MSEAAWLRLQKRPRPPGSVLNFKLPNSHGNRLDFLNSDFARLLSSPRTFIVPSLVKICQEIREEIAHKHFQCPRMPGSVFCQIIVRYSNSFLFTFLLILDVSLIRKLHSTHISYNMISYSYMNCVMRKQSVPNQCLEVLSVGGKTMLAKNRFCLPK